MQSSQTLLNEDALSYNNSNKSSTNSNNNNTQKTIPGTNRRIISSANDGTHLVEIEADTTLFFYGAKSLEEIDNQLSNNNNNNNASSVATISFHYIDFNHIAKYFIKIRNKFQNLNVSIKEKFIIL